MTNIVAPGYRGVQEVRYGASSQTIRTWPDEDGATQTVSSATVDVFTPGAGSPESTPLVSAASMTVASNNELTYALNCSNTGTYPLGEGYRAEVTYVVSSVNYFKTIIFDVVREPIIHHLPVRVDDLKALHPEVATWMAATTIGGLNAETAAAQLFIVPAWQDVLNYIREKGFRPALVSPPESLYAMLLEASAVRLFRAMSHSMGDLHWEHKEEAKQRYKQACATTQLRYAEGDTHSAVVRREWTQPQTLVGPDLRGGDTALFPAIYWGRR